MGIDRNTLRHFHDLLRPLRNRIANSLVRAAVKLVADGGKIQKLQIDGFEGGPASDAEHFQAYGFSSVPLAGAEAIAGFPNGDRERPWILVVTDRRYRPKGNQPGEVTVYNNTQAQVKLTKDGDIVETPAAGRTIKLGSDTAVDAAIKGTTRNTAEQTFLTAMGAFVTATSGLPGMSGPAGTFGTAITAFATAAANALALKVKLE